MATKVRVVIADDHPMVRSVVRMACDERPGLEVVGEAADGLDTVKLCSELMPDVLVLDLMLPGLDGFEVARTLRLKKLTIKILILTARDDARAILDSMTVGVEGILGKDSDLSQMGVAIERIAAGESMITEEQNVKARSQLADFVRRSREGSHAREVLTDREIDVLELISEGLTNRVMSRRLGISQRTLESHIKKMYRKLGVNSRLQAAGKARELGLLGGNDSSLSSND